MEPSLKTESWGHEYSTRASVTVPISQLRSNDGLGREVAEKDAQTLAENLRLR